MTRHLVFAAILCFAFSCNRTAPEHDTENARDQSIMKSDSQPQDHTGVAPDSSKNTPGMNIGNDRVYRSLEN